MPRLQQTQPNRRLPVDPRDTFDFTTPNLEVISRPVDAYVKPAEGSRLSQLVHALSSVNSGLTAYGGYAQKEYNKKVEEGALAGMAGQEKPTKSEAMIKGWEEITGAKTARTDFRNEVNNLLAKSSDMTFQELDEEYNTILGKYLKGSPENFVKGFAPEALSIEESFFSAYQNQQQKLMRQKAYDTTMQVALSEVEAGVDDTLNFMFSGDIALDDVRGNQAVYSILDEQNFSQTFATEIREALTQTQSRVNALGLGRAEVSELFLDAVGRKAIELGMPELLEFAYLKDSNGDIALADTASLGPKAENYKKLAKEARNDYKDAREAQAVKEHEKMLNNFYVGAHKTIQTITLEEDGVKQAALARQAMTDLESNPLWEELSVEQRTKIIDQVITLRSNEFSFPERSSKDAWIHLQALAFDGELTEEVINDAIASNELSKPDFESAMQLLDTQRNKQKQEAKTFTDERWIMDQTSAYASVLVKMNEAGIFINLEEGPATLANFEDMNKSAILTWRDANGRYPTYKEWKDQIIDPILNLMGTSVNNISGYINAADAPDILSAEKPMERYRERSTFFQDLRRMDWRKLGTRVFNTFAPVKYELDFPGEVDITMPASGWSYDRDQTFGMISDALGLTDVKISDIKYYLTTREEDPQDPTAVDWYLDWFAYQVAYRTLWANEYRNARYDAIPIIQENLLDAGYSEEQVEKAIQQARWKLAEDEESE